MSNRGSSVIKDFTFSECEQILAMLCKVNPMYKGNLAVTVRVPKKGFHMGERCNFTFHTDNPEIAFKLRYLIVTAATNIRLEKRSNA